MGRPTQYRVSLSQEEKEKLLAMSKDNNLSVRVSKRVLILLALDNKKDSNLNHRQIASALNTTVTTIVATARNYSRNGRILMSSSSRKMTSGNRVLLYTRSSG